MTKTIDIESFIGTYEAIVPYGRNVYRFMSDILAEVKKLAELRRKDWMSTARWNPAADETGLLSELAFHKAMGTLGEQALEGFISGLNGDDGADWVTPQGDEVDVKATRGKALRFKFNHRNPFSHRAPIVSFASVKEENEEAFVTLLGWAWKCDINGYLRKDERYDYVNFETLRREGLVYPVTMLKSL